MASKVPRVRTKTNEHLVGKVDFPDGVPMDSRYPIYSRHYEGLLVSEPHHRLKDGSWSGGGPLLVYKVHGSHKNPTTTRFYDMRTLRLYYNIGSPHGGVPSTLPQPPTWTICRANASKHYATGYSRAKPGGPLVDFGQFVCELRDLPSVPAKGLLNVYRRLIRRHGGTVWGLPRVLHKELLNFRNLGSEYLNIVFGWEPFVRDLRLAYQLYKDLDKHLAQIVRDNGRGIRRGSTVLSNSTVTQTEATASYPFAFTYGGGLPRATGRSHVTVTTQTTEKVWFAGKFRYYIPDIGSSAWTARATFALFGMNPTPELLWNIMPWSWLIDWFTNVGDVVSNMNSGTAENLTCLYSFIMRETKYARVANSTTSWNPYSYKDLSYWEGGCLNHSSEYVESLKTRVGGGNPFGLDVQLPSLSTKQLAILAALGVSRSAVK